MRFKSRDCTDLEIQIIAWTPDNLLALTTRMIKFGFTSAQVHAAVDNLVDAGILFLGSDQKYRMG